MNFVDTPICQSRSNCFHCRTNENFRKQMELEHGPIECPENIPIGAKLEDLPEKSQEAHKKMEEMQEKRKQQIEEVNMALDELQMISSDEGKKLVDKIRGFISPNTKTPEKCKHAGKNIGEIDEECCGGKINKKPAFSCKKHTITTAKKCMGCMDFESK